MTKLNSSALEIAAVDQSYGNKKVLKSIDLSVSDGRIVCLLGPSGCGKTTLLRCIAGFEEITSGRIDLKGKRVNGPGFLLAPEKRGVGVVFQDYALFPHLTVFENIGFGIRHLSRSERSSRVKELLHSIELSEYAQQYPRQLSGGQQQRVALARALAPEPGILLLDEPFSHLDPSLREKMKFELKTLLKKFGVTAILVTHDQDEAFDLADDVALMIGGQIAQFGSPDQIYFHPVSKAVSDFIGSGFYLEGHLQDTGEILTELGVVHSDKPGLVLCRPTDVIVDQSSPFEVTILSLSFRGTHSVIHAKTAKGTPIQFWDSDRSRSLKEGENLRIRLNPLAEMPVFS